MTMTNQEYFDATVAGLRAQGEPAFDGYSCKYRLTKGDKTLKCAAGLHIPDGVYHSGMETNLVDTLDCLRGLGTPELRRDLQRVHDIAAGDDDVAVASFARCHTDARVPAIAIYNSMAAIDPTWTGPWLNRVEAGFKHIAEKYQLNYTSP